MAEVLEPGTMIGKGRIDGTLSPDEIAEVIREMAAELNVTGKRVLTIIPDGTRTMPMPLIFDLLQREIGTRAAASDYLIALGTHPPMSDDHLSSHLGQTVSGGRCGGAKIFNHRWDLPDTFAEIGMIPANVVARISGGLLAVEVPIRINRLVFDYDQILICGPVFPHEVVGFSGGNKYLFPGIGGAEIINWTHWLGALLGSYEIIGSGYTPVREMIDYAAAKVSTPVACLSLVVTHEGVSGMYFGGPQESWRAASQLSSQKHIVWVDRPFQRVLSVMPRLYDDLWTAAKGMYKVEPAIADGGEVIIYAPHITEFSYTHGQTLEEIGYHCRDYFLKQWDRFKDLAGGVLAHSTHLRGLGTYDAAIGEEHDRIKVTLATGISRERVEAVNLSYMDPAEIEPDEWAGREEESILLVPKAGEMLYRIKPQVTEEIK